MKRIFKVLLVLILILTFQSCGDNKPTDSSSINISGVVQIVKYKTYDGFLDSRDESDILRDCYDLKDIELSYFVPGQKRIGVFSNDEFKLFVFYDEIYPIKKILVDVTGNIDINGKNYNNESSVKIDVNSYEDCFILDLKLYSNSILNISYLIDENDNNYQITARNELHLILNNDFIEFLDDTKLKFKLKNIENLSNYKVYSSNNEIEPIDGVYEIQMLDTSVITYNYMYEDSNLRCVKQMSDYSI